jgi:hypothetical protein
MIAEKPNQIVRLEERLYKVASQSGRGMYDVIKKKESSGWLCTCPDFEFRNANTFGLFNSASRFVSRFRLELSNP